MAVIEYVKNVSGKTEAHGAKRGPKDSIKAVISGRVNCPTISNNRGRPAP